ncbi:toll/interleukin-1 receptor domain-containing protein [Streptomyces sp. cg35]|uniref:toll/interleukin-1 receptor domain-containing protein n=1 Tax=Streptomyces sp. cg35 TaxID=3421650 RepID=UPI003D182300
MTGIFINYRTGDGGEAAVLIDNDLRLRFGDDQVFRDRRAMEPGIHYPPEMARRLEASTVVLVLIGEHWLKVTDESGNRRIDDPDDWVHWEIRRALDLGKIVVPLLLDGAALPTKGELPSRIAQLAERQNSRLVIPYAHEQMAPIRAFLERHVQPRPAAPAVPPPSKYHVASNTGVVGDWGTYIENDNSGLRGRRDPDGDGRTA